MTKYSKSKMLRERIAKFEKLEYVFTYIYVYTYTQEKRSSL